MMLLSLCWIYSQSPQTLLNEVAMRCRLNEIVTNKECGIVKRVKIHMQIFFHESLSMRWQSLITAIFFNCKKWTTLYPTYKICLCCKLSFPFFSFFFFRFSGDRRVWQLLIIEFWVCLKQLVTISVPFDLLSSCRAAST